MQQPCSDSVKKGVRSLFSLVTSIIILMPGLALAQIPPASSHLFCLFYPDICKDNNPTIPSSEEEPPATGKLIIEADAWVGNKPVTAGTQLQIGHNTLVISNQKISGTNEGFQVPNYTLPTTGKTVWTNLDSLMLSRAVRAATTTQAPPLTCTNQPLKEINFEKTPILFVAASGSQPCTIILDGTLIRHTGTIINASQNEVLQAGRTNQPKIRSGKLDIRGKVVFDAETTTLGYIAFSDKPDSDTGKVILGEKADVKNLAIFTEGTAEIKPNTTATARFNELQLISRFITFPDLKKMKNDLTLKRPTTLFHYPPPDFESLATPGGGETP